MQTLSHAILTGLRVNQRIFTDKLTFDQLESCGLAGIDTDVIFGGELDIPANVEIVVSSTAQGVVDGVVYEARTITYGDRHNFLLKVGASNAAIREAFELLVSTEALLHDSEKLTMVIVVPVFSTGVHQRHDTTRDANFALYGEKIFLSGTK